MNNYNMVLITNNLNIYYHLNSYYKTKQYTNKSLLTFK